MAIEEIIVMDKITVKEIDVRYKKIDSGDFICLTDIAKYKNPEDPRFIVYSWLRNKDTIRFSRAMGRATQSKV